MSNRATDGRSGLVAAGFLRGWEPGCQERQEVGPAMFMALGGRVGQQSMGQAEQGSALRVAAEVDLDQG